MIIGIVCYPTFGGSGVVATELGLALARKGHKVHFITYSQPVRLSLLHENVFFHEVVVPEYPLFHYQPYELALSSKIVDMVKLHGIELLHVHYAIPHAFAGYMAKKMLQEAGLSLPMVTTLHGTDITLVGNHPFYKTAVSFSINQSDAVTAVSENLRASTYELFDTKKTIEVIPNFIDRKNKENCQLCKQLLIKYPNQRVITHISNFRKVKRIEDVIQVFYRIQKQIPSRLMMIGDGPEKVMAEDLVKKIGIENEVVFFGNTQEIDEILFASDLFLLPSETESFGLAALEAMACSVPVVSSNTGGIPEVNIHGKTGYLAPVGAVDEMAQWGIKLLQSDDVLNRFKNQALEHAREFSIEKIIPMYEAVYKKVMGN